MTLKKYVSALFLLLSIYCFVFPTIFGGTLARYLYFLAPPKSDGAPLPFAPHQLVPYYNTVIYSGLVISGLLFCVAVEPYITPRFKNRRAVSVPVTLLVTPVYFVLLFLITAGVKKILA